MRAKPDNSLARTVALRARRRTAGFTLIELMTVVSVLAVLSMLAAPSFQRLLVEQRLASAASSLNALLWFARSETIKRNAPVNVEVADATSWTVYRCTTGMATCAATQREVLQVAAPGHSALDIDARAFRFGPEGRLTEGAGAFELADAGGAIKRCVTINSTGRTQSQPGACP